MSEKLKDSEWVFSLNDQQIKEARAFMKKHDKKHGGPSQATAGERYSFIFVPCSLGTLAVIECSCKKSVMLGDL